MGAGRADPAAIQALLPSALKRLSRAFRMSWITLLLGVTSAIASPAFAVASDISASDIFASTMSASTRPASTRPASTRPAPEKTGAAAAAAQGRVEKAYAAKKSILSTLAPAALALAGDGAPYRSSIADSSGLQDVLQDTLQGALEGALEGALQEAREGTLQDRLRGPQQEKRQHNQQDAARNATKAPGTTPPVRLAQSLPDARSPADPPVDKNPFAPVTPNDLPDLSTIAPDPTESDISGFADLARPVLRAQISPRRQTVLSAEIAGKIDSYPLREGERFEEGDPLVGFDCAVHIARRDRSRAMEQSARRRLETAGRLDQLNSISRLEYDEAVAAVAVAEAETALSEIAVARCTIEAPFPGRVAERLADPFQYVAEGEPVIAILDDRDLEVALMMPSRWLAWLKPGHGFSVAIDELGSTLEARIARIGARVDPISQSIRVFGAITDAPEGLMAGMSGEADLRPPDHHQDGAR